MTKDEQAALRKPFPADQIGKLPKPTKKENPKGRCDECGGYHGLPAIHLDYVGHAATTDRILSVDPTYEFGPVLDVNRLPITRGSEMLHYLTIRGATRYEWGEGPNMKEISSDAIRRCAMRFGVALDLWAKEPLGDVDGDAASKYAKAPRSRSSSPSKPAARSKPRASHIALLSTAKDANVDDDLRHRIIRMLTNGRTQSVKELDDEQADMITAQLVWLRDNRSACLDQLVEWEGAHPA